jgi:hypothetical protein
MKNYFPVILFSALLGLSSCSKTSDKENHSKPSVDFIQKPETPPVRQESTTIAEKSVFRKAAFHADQTEEKIILEKLKKLSLREVFNKNMPFTENKGQLEKWHNISIERIGDIKFYTQAFGGTAYFGENGIGVGFFREDLDLIESDKINTKQKKGQKKNTLFLYIDHPGCNQNVKLEGWAPRETKLNYFKGREDEFITDIKSYDGMIYKELYHHIDLKYSMADNHLVYDYIVGPGGKVTDIKRSFAGVERISIHPKTGELEIYTDWGILTDKKPYAYQIINGKTKEVKVKYIKLSENTAGFDVGYYDKTKELVIDPPTLSFATFATPGGIDGYIHDIALDAAGNIYTVGWTNGSDNTTLVTPFDNSPAGGDALLYKLKSDGTTMLYASFIGGDGNGGTNEVAFGVAVNSSNQCYVAGFTDVSTNFPAAGTPIQASVAGSKDIFVIKVNAAGTGLIYSTFYGGTGDDRGFGIALNSSDEAFVTGWTTSTASFATAGAYQTAKGVGGAFGYDAFVLKIHDVAGVVTKDYCTYFGGTNEDMGRAIAVNGGDVFITGVSQSTNLPRTVGATFGGGSGGGAFDAYIARINGATGNNLVYCTYVGGDFDEKAEGIAINSGTNEAFITGWTKSIIRNPPAPGTAGSFPIVNPITGYAQNADAGGNVRDAFMTRVDATGVIVNSTYMGALGEDNVKNGNAFDPLVQHRSGDLTVNAAGNVAVVMSTDGGTAFGSATLPTISSVDVTFNGGNTGLGDAYIFVLGTDAQTLLFTTYFGGNGNDYPTAGIHFDASDCLIIGGGNHSSTLPVTAGVYGPSRKGGTGSDENYIAKYCTVILPVDLLAFHVKNSEGNTILLRWQTASEKDNKEFIVERSADGVHFSAVGTVEGNGNSSVILSYSFTDHPGEGGTYYYRLKQVDINGDSRYSEIKQVSILVLGNIQITPNPGNGLLKIQVNLPADTEIEISILSTLGEKIYVSHTKAGKGAYEKDINIQSFASGVYLVRITAGNEVKTLKYVKE